MRRTKASLLRGARDVSPIMPGIVPFGLVAGAAVVDAGLGLPEAIGMSLLVNAGASQIAATSLFAEDAPLIVALATGLIVNARLLIYSTSIAPVIAPPAGRWRAIVGHALVDQSYAATMTLGRYSEGIDIVPYYLGSFLSLAAIWQVSNVAGALAGALVPTSLGLDFAVPLVFLAMLVPALKTRADIEAAIVSAIGAALLVPTLPLQTGLPAAIVLGMLWGAVRHAQGERGGP